LADGAAVVSAWVDFTAPAWAGGVVLALLALEELASLVREWVSLVPEE